MLLLKMI